MKIRIAVAVDSDGRWESCGRGYSDPTDDMTDKQKCDDAMQLQVCGGDRCHVVIVEADVPLPPETQTVEGTVTLP